MWGGLNWIKLIPELANSPLFYEVSIPALQQQRVSWYANVISSMQPLTLHDRQMKLWEAAGRIFCFPQHEATMPLLHLQWAESDNHYK